MSADNTQRWFHCILTTYGAWLPGDPRGFRTRHHREHIEGDYKDPPPPEKYAARHRRSKSLQKFPTVTFSPADRQHLGATCVCYLQEREIQILSLALGGRHLHLQLRPEPSRVIRTLGEIKRKLWYERRSRGNAQRLWGIGRKVVPIKCQAHQRQVLSYILAHRHEGAWVWCYRDPIP
jgi:hypothetical protein